MAKIPTFASRFLLKSCNNNSLVRRICLKAAPRIKEVEEVSIDVPWGHVAGKWWGPKNVRPILLLHGWQDNAGSFDRIIPLLPNHLSYLAIDIPGHGISSHFPPGMTYNLNDSVHLIGIIQRYYGWEKVSLIGHSMGCQINFMYCSLNPNLCDMLISLDVLKPLIMKTTNIMTNMRYCFDKLSENEERNRIKSVPPVYSKEDLIKLLVKASRNSITPETAHYILNRGVKQTEYDANKFYVSRDSRIKYFTVTHFYSEMIKEMISNFNTPYLFIKATQSPYYEDKKYFDEALAILKNNKHGHFEHYFVNSNHHVHLTNPHLVSGYMTNFINKYRPS